MVILSVALKILTSFVKYGYDMRRALFFAVYLILFVHSTCFAKPVTVDAARIVAQNWMTQQTGVRTSASLLARATTAPKTHIEPAPYYIFNLDSNGWVIVSGDDVAYPVIGYSTHGNANPQNQPPAFIEWMAQVEKQIKSAITQSLQYQRSSDPTTIKVQNAWASLNNTENIVRTESSAADIRISVSPLLRTKWSQEKYYNAKCPYDTAGPDNHALVGCVATAMGQIMKFHEWPPTGTGSHTNNCDYGALYVNFGDTTYNWNSMPDTGSLYSYNYAVATLLYHVGVAVDMDYGPYSSAAYSSDVAPALRNYFRYKADDLKSRSSYTNTTWLVMLRSDLNANQPIYYKGSGTGAHAFVCDGYSGTDYFHFNWGWNGDYDMYFYLGDLTPGSHNYNDAQGAILGITPKQLADLTPYKPSAWNDKIPVSRSQLSGTDTHSDTEPYYNDETLYINYACTNNGNVDSGDFIIKLEITGEGGEILTYSKLPLSDGYYTYNPTDIAIGPLSAGTHTIKMWVDHYNSVPESNESNNYYERTVTVLAREVTLVLPSGTITDNTPTYAWNKLEDDSVTGYVLYVNDSVGNRIDRYYYLSELTFDSVNQRYFVTPEIQLNEGNGQWWVCAYNGNYGSWSDPMQFNLVNHGSYTPITRKVPEVYPNIQTAIDASVDSDTVLLADGVYTGPGNLNIDFKGKKISVKSKNGPDTCTVDCQKHGRGFLFCTGEDEHSLLDGITITNGNAEDSDGGAWSRSSAGGGIYIANASATIHNCKIVNNSANSGGGAYSSGGSLFENCKFTANTAADSGGAVYGYDPKFIGCSFNKNRSHGTYRDGGAIAVKSTHCEDCIFDENFATDGGAVDFSAIEETSFIRCKFINNVAQDDGGAICISQIAFLDLTVADITNCIFSNNHASDGGAICSKTYLRGKALIKINNCSFSYNVATGYGGALFLRNEVSFPDKVISINNCIAYGNYAPYFPEIYETEKPVTVTFSDIRGGHAGEGNIDANPLFLSIDTTGDLYPHPDSPCIDAGTSDDAPADDIDGYLRPIGPGYDMGAYEYRYNVFIWEGQTSDWHDTTNWNYNELPKSTDFVIISSPDAVMDPELYNGEATVRTVMIESGTLTIDQGKLSVGGH